MSKKIIFVLGGGTSSEREVSVRSAKFVYDEILDTMYDKYLIDVTDDGWYVTMNDNARYQIDKNDLSVTIDRKIKPDYVLNIVHGTPGENGLISGFLEMLKIPHLGCSTLTSALTFDKVWCKRIVAEYGIPLAKDYVIKKDDTFDSADIVKKLGLPIFVKPSNSGSSFGVTKVKEEKYIAEAVEKAYTEDGVVIIEECISGREVACGVYVTAKGAHFLPVTEIISDNEFFDYEAKYNGASKEITPANISEEVRAKLEEYTLFIYNLLRCHGIVRVDYIVRNDTPYFIEVNTIPGMSAASLVPQQLAHLKLSVNEVITEIIEN